MNPTETIYQIIEKISLSNPFRTEYAEDGYITISKKSDDEYEIDIQQVSFLDQATHTFYHYTTQELVRYLEQNIEKLGKA